MATGKTSTLTFRIEPGLKEVPRAAAEREHRIERLRSLGYLDAQSPKGTRNLAAVHSQREPS